MLYRIPTSRPADGPPRRVVLRPRLLRGLAQRFAAWTLYRNTAIQLRDLDDHLLADIGVPRDKIDARARNVVDSK